MNSPGYELCPVNGAKCRFSRIDPALSDLRSLVARVIYARANPQNEVFPNLNHTH